MALTATTPNRNSKLATSNLAGISREIWDSMKSQIRRPIYHSPSHGHSAWTHSRGSLDVMLPEVSKHGEAHMIEDTAHGAYTPVKFIAVAEHGPHTRIKITGGKVIALSPFVCCRLNGTAKGPIGKATPVAIPEPKHLKVRMRVNGIKAATYTVMSEIEYDLWQRSNYKRNNARVNDGREVRADLVTQRAWEESALRMLTHNRATMARSAKKHEPEHWTMQARQTFSMFAANHGFSIVPAKTMTA